MLDTTFVMVLCWDSNGWDCSCRVVDQIWYDDKQDPTIIPNRALDTTELLGFVCRGAPHIYFSSSSRGRTVFICLEVIRNHCSRKTDRRPLAFFPGRLTWTVK